jgi:hypothetical protein
MSSTDNWIKLYRWWQEHLKSHFNSPSSSSTTMVENLQQRRTSLLHRRSSLMSFRSSNKSQCTTVKKRASFGGVVQGEQAGSTNGGFRYVRDSIRNKNSRTTRSTAPIAMNKKGSVYFKFFLINILFSIILITN